MYSLIVRQSLDNGAVKTWKLRAGQEPHTFGSSRLSNVISISAQSKGIQGYFEFRENSWWYVDMDIVNGTENKTCAVRVDSELCLRIDDFKLELQPHVRVPQVHTRLLNNQYTSNPEKARTYQIFMLKREELVLETKLVPIKSKFRSAAFPYLAPVAVRPSDNWISEFQGDFEILQKSVSVEDATLLKNLPMSEVVDPKSKRAVYAFLAVSFFLMFTSFLIPPSEPHISAVTPPKAAQKIIVKTELKPKRKKQPAPQQVAIQDPAPPSSAAATKDTGGASRVSKLLGNKAGGRISQLIGKVSSQAAKTNNVVIASGVKAGEGASGRALAAVGKMAQSGRDWGQEGNGQGVTISTVGKGGGKSASSIGGLAAGSTGSAGVGLIEDEGEITGGLDREIIAQYIKSKLGQILYCYERQLSANPELFGKVAVKFTIGPTGAVEQQLIGDTTLKNANVEGCILNRVAAWKFPSPEGGTRVIVTYPFLFKSTN